MWRILHQLIMISFGYWGRGHVHLRHGIKHLLRIVQESTFPIHAKDITERQARMGAGYEYMVMNLGP